MLVLSIEILPRMFCIYLYQYFIKQYKNTGSYYRNFFFINVTIINNLFQEFTCWSITKLHTGTFILDLQDMHYNYIM